MKKKKLKLKKKSYVIITILILIIILLLIKIFIYDKKIRGEKIDLGIYHYSIKGKEDEYIPTKIEKDNIYYLINDNYKYILYKRNIHRKEASKIGELDGKYDYCDFDKGFVNCSKNGEYYYDYKLNLIYSKPYDKDNPFNIIYYQDKFYIVQNQKIFDDNDNLIKELKFDFPEASLFGDYTINDITYLIFYSRKERNYLYYNLKNDTYEIKDDLLNIKYDEGFYSIVQGNIVTYNFLNNKITEYKDLNINQYARATLIKNNIFYFIENNQLYALDLVNKTIQRYDYKFDKEIGSITYTDNYLYLTSYMQECNIYAIDTNEATKTTFPSVDEYKEYMNKYLDDKVKELEDKFHIDIVYRDEVNIKNETFKTTVMDNIYILNTALNTTETVLNKFNTEFFDKFREKNNKGIVIYFSGEIIPMEGANTTSYPSGYTLANDKEYGVVVDVNGYGLKGTLCHELMHNTEYRMNTNLYTEWFKKNPKKFEYQYTYVIDADSKYTTIEEDKDNTYFVDSYAKSYPTEDVARIFENVCNKEEESTLLEYPHLYDKALYLKEVMEKEFPSLKEATVFNSLKK